jgi:hypothetical protein
MNRTADFRPRRIGSAACRRAARVNCRPRRISGGACAALAQQRRGKPAAVEASLVSRSIAA